eukprot:TRINITY_DN6878_c2_g1_i1.p1 TRINITY_DN6878_c2_g1~~TRINITY_DN6878_c2_g1_i1.p1  ORF type:complete len:106 (+),score=0.66 TRINITY_DN6878_c2_g1_i1:40-357(+)
MSDTMIDVQAPLNHRRDGQIHNNAARKATELRSQQYPSNFARLTDRCEDSCRATIDDEGSYFAKCRDTCIANEYLKRGLKVPAGAVFYWRDEWEYMGGGTQSTIH